jgi:CheY-like chemotaxis protein
MMPKTLLLADDSVVIQKLVGLSFANEDVELVTVDNGDDAVTRAQELNPDLVLADVVMPGKSGYEVCEAIKKDPKLSGTPVLLLTGTFEAFDEVRAQTAGADGQITKPFEAQALVDRVNEILTRAPQAAVAPPADAGSDFFDDTLTAPADSLAPDALVPDSLVNLDSLASPSTDFDLGVDLTAGSDPLGSFDSSADGLSDLDLPPAAEPSPIVPDAPPPAFGGPGSDETIALMPDFDEDPLANTADMPIAFPDVPAPPTPIDADPGVTVLADDSFATVPVQDTTPDAGYAFDGLDNRGDNHGNNRSDDRSDINSTNNGTKPQAFDRSDGVASLEPAPAVSLPPPPQPPAPLPGDFEPTTERADLDDLNFTVPPPIPADPGETMLADDLFAGAPPLSQEPVVDLDAPPVEGLSDFDFDVTSPGGSGSAASSFVPENVDEYDVSSSDLGPPQPPPAPEWAETPGVQQTTPENFAPAPPSPSPDLASPAPLVSPDPGAPDSLDAAWPAETASDDSEPLFGSAPAGLVADPIAGDTGSGASMPAGSPPLEAPLGTPEPVLSADQGVTELPITRIDTPSGGTSPGTVQNASEDPAPIAVKPDLSPMLRDRVHDTLEKVAWEAFSDLSETVVRQILQRIEEIAWEVIPQMTEAMVREEIRRMKDEDES